MNVSIRKAALASLVAAALAASLIGVASTGASAIDYVPCGPADYLDVQWHASWGAENTQDYDSCFANGGEYSDFDGNDDLWVTKISTGNNRVQWFGDGRWQPDTPIPPWTVYTWPHQQYGVSFDKIRIV